MPDINDDVRAALKRYIGDYHWSWNMAGRLLKRKFGIELSKKKLEELYSKMSEK